MNRDAKLMLLGFLAVVSSGAAMSGSPSVGVEVFALSTMPIVNARDANVYYLDGIAQVEAALTDGLPLNEQQARAITEDRIRRLGRGLNEKMRQAGTGLGRALELRLQRAPAIVFNGQYVVYGVTDVDGARRIYSGVRQ